MNMLKRLPIVTIIVALCAALYWKDDIMSVLDKHAPAVSKFFNRTKSS